MIHPKELIKIGLYGSEQEAIEDGIRHLLLSHPEYRIEIAIERYKVEEVSLGKATDLTGLSVE